jgi:hypothetical protein
MLQQNFIKMLSGLLYTNNLGNIIQFSYQNKNILIVEISGQL